METFDLGRAIATAESIKGMRRQSRLDQLREQGLQGQIAGQEQAFKIAGAQEERAGTKFTQEQQITNTKLLNAASAEVMQNPAATERWLPQLIKAGVFPQGTDPNAWRSVPPEQIQAKAREYYESTSAALSSLAGPQDTGPLQAYVDPKTGKPVYGTRTEARGQRPYDKPPTTQVTLDTRQESEEDKAVGRAFGEQYVDIQKAGMAADSKIARLNRMEQLAGDIETGRLTPAAVQAAGYLKSFGIDIDPKLGAKEAAIAISSEMALQLRNPAGGAGMPGAMSDKDREFLQAMSPNLAQSREGRALIVESGRQLAKRDKEIAKLSREYRKKNGRIDEGFFEELSQYGNENPLFTGDYRTATGPNGEKMVLYKGKWIPF